jgi:hypothetical protein
VREVLKDQQRLLRLHEELEPKARAHGAYKLKKKEKEEKKKLNDGREV